MPQTFVLPRQIAHGSGQIFPLAVCSFYRTGTTTAQAVYLDAALTNGVTSITANAAGEFPKVYPDPAAAFDYRVKVEAPTGGLIYQEDDISAMPFTQGDLAGTLSPQTAEEGSAGVTPSNFAYEPGNLLRYGADPTGAIPSDTAVASCQSAGYRVYAPRGTYRFDSTIAVKAPGFIGDGPNLTFLRFVGVDAFTLASNEGISRPQCVISGFSVDASAATNCDSKFVFKAAGVATAAAAVYNSGIVVRDITIGRNNRFGGAFYVKDVFSMNVENISMTDVTRGIQLVGSVVQCSFRNISAFSDNAGSALSSIGFSTESATYSGAAVLTPEHITTKDCSWIVFTTGISHTAGLDINIYDTDVQTVTTGIVLNAPCDLNGAVILPHSAGVTTWTGISLGVSPGTKDARYISNVDITVANTPGTPSGSYGIDIGDGASPCYGVFITRSRIKGNAASLQSLIRGRICKELDISYCVMDDDVALSTEVSLASTQRLSMLFNHCAGGTFAVGDGGDSAATGMILFNQIDTLTLSPITTRTNWIFDINEAIKRKTWGATSVADGGTVTHGLSSTPARVNVTPTITGEFVSVTAVGASTFTLAIKKFDNSAGTTQTVYWEAEY